MPEIAAAVGFGIGIPQIHAGIGPGDPAARGNSLLTLVIQPDRSIAVKGIVGPHNQFVLVRFAQGKRAADIFVRQDAVPDAGAGDFLIADAHLDLGGAGDRAIARLRGRLDRASELHCTFDSNMSFTSSFGRSYSRQSRL